MKQEPIVMPPVHGHGWIAAYKLDVARRAKPVGGHFPALEAYDSGSHLTLRRRKVIRSSSVDGDPSVSTVRVLMKEGEHCDYTVPCEHLKYEPWNLNRKQRYMREKAIA